MFIFLIWKLVLGKNSGSSRPMPQVLFLQKWTKVSVNGGSSTPFWPRVRLALRVLFLSFVEILHLMISYNILCMLHNGGYSQTTWVVVTLLAASNHENVSHTHMGGAQKGATGLRRGKCIRLAKVLPEATKIHKDFNLTQIRPIQVFVNSCEFIPGRRNSLMSCKMHVKQFQGSTLLDGKQKQSSVSQQPITAKQNFAKGEPICCFCAGTTSQIMGSSATPCWCRRPFSAHVLACI